MEEWKVVHVRLERAAISISGEITTIFTGAESMYSMIKYWIISHISSRATCWKTCDNKPQNTQKITQPSGSIIDA